MDVKNNTLIYFGDPLCSWCYGFSPEISRVKEESGYDFKLVMGGLRPGGTDTLGSLQSFLEQHWIEIEKRSGQPFDYTIFENSDMILDTEPSARAVVTARKLNPELEFNFYKEVQKAFYSNKKDTTRVETYEAICDRLGLPFSEFSSVFSSEDLRKEVLADFAFSKGLGVRGFPTVALKANDNYYLVSNGYMKADQILETIDQIRSVISMGD